MTLQVKPVIIKFTKNIKEFKNGYSSNKAIKKDVGSSDNKENMGDWIHKLVGLATRKYEDRSHEKIHSHTKSLKCEKCDKTFSGKDHLLSHQIVHNKGRLHRCEMCDKAFPFLFQLTQHTKTHTRPFNCSVCFLSFTRINHLNRHVEQIHVKPKHEKTFKCSTCDISFTRSDHLKRHFTRKIHLDRHVKTEHVKPYSCTSCDKSYTRADHLKRHCQQKHQKHNSALN